MSDIPQQPVLLFSYGTLQQRAAQRANFGRELNGTPDHLPAYELSMVRITDPEVVAISGTDRHPIACATGDPSDHVDGTVFEITDSELTAADRYEADDYSRAFVPLASGVRAWVYAASHIGSH